MLPTHDCSNIASFFVLGRHAAWDQRANAWPISTGGNTPLTQGYKHVCRSRPPLQPQCASGYCHRHPSTLNTPSLSFSHITIYRGLTSTLNQPSKCFVYPVRRPSPLLPIGHGLLGQGSLNIIGEYSTKKHGMRSSQFVSSEIYLTPEHSFASFLH